MIVELISKYLETHKRLVVPNLGAFIVKIPGESVLFSNLIKNDDGVLRSLLMSSGVSEMEAAAAIDRFVFEIRIRLQNNGVCRLGGFGELRSGAMRPYRSYTLLQRPKMAALMSSRNLRARITSLRMQVSLRITIPLLRVPLRVMLSRISPGMRCRRHRLRSRVNSVRSRSRMCVRRVRNRMCIRSGALLRMTTVRSIVRPRLRKR
ncbi:MAG: hypothetical protein L6V80_07775 [Bacteroidales bacterium]|nr:MAG: hypothetical protein L6V80_07775 [Bacteroidales bacterium]